jgi:hypothetical protein
MWGSSERSAENRDIYLHLNHHHHHHHHRRRHHRRYHSEAEIYALKFFTSSYM